MCSFCDAIDKLWPDSSEELTFAQFDEILSLARAAERAPGPHHAGMAQTQGLDHAE